MAWYDFFRSRSSLGNPNPSEEDRARFQQNSGRYDLGAAVQRGMREPSVLGARNVGPTTDKMLIGGGADPGAGLAKAFPGGVDIMNAVGAGFRNFGANAGPAFDWFKSLRAKNGATWNQAQVQQPSPTEQLIAGGGGGGGWGSAPQVPSPGATVPIADSVGGGTTTNAFAPQNAAGLPATYLPGLVPPPVKPPAKFDYDPLSGKFPASDLDNLDNPDDASGFFNKAVAGLQVGQQDIIDVRASQPMNVADLEAARVGEGYQQARSDWEMVQTRINDFNRRVNNIEQEVRDALGEDVSESRVQAEINNRMRTMQPEFNRLSMEAQNAKARYDLTVDAVTQQFNARRADAKENVDRAMQKYGFRVENVNTAYSMMVGLKNYELLVDAQTDKKRDAARAEFSALLAANALAHISDAELYSLAQRSQLSPSALAGIKTMQRQGTFWVNPNAPVDDAGNLNYVWKRPDGSLDTGRFSNFATVIPKASSASIAALKLRANMSSTLTEAWKQAVKGIQEHELSGKMNEAQRRDLYAYTYSYLLENSDVKNDADGAFISDFLNSSGIGSTIGESTFNRTTGQFEGTIQALSNDETQ